MRARGRSFIPLTELHTHTHCLCGLGRLVCNAKDRLGTTGGVEEIKKHPFLAGVDWVHTHHVEAQRLSHTHTRSAPQANLAKAKAPHVPAVGRYENHRHHHRHWLPQLSWY